MVAISGYLNADENNTKAANSDAKEKVVAEKNRQHPAAKVVVAKSAKAEDNKVSDEKSKK